MEVCRVIKPNFQSMSRKDLHVYILSHRNDHEAFYAYIDKLYAEATWIDMPPLESSEDLESHPEFIEHVRSRS